MFAEYSTPLDRIIMASDNPPQVHVYEPVTRTTLSVTLAKTPLALRLTPDGQRAIVGQDALVSLVYLNTLTIERSYPVPFAANYVDGSATWIWARSGQWSQGVSIQIDTGAQTTYLQGTAAGEGRFNSRINALFTTDYGTYGIRKVDVSSGLLGNQTGVSGLSASCAPFLLITNQTRVVTGCGTVVETGDTGADAARELTRLNATFNGSRVTFRAFAESPSRGQIAAIPASWSADDTVVWVLDNAYFNPAGRLALTDYPGGFRARGRWLFFNAASSSLYVISQADASANLTLDFGVHTIPMDPPNPCGAVLSPTSVTVPAGGIMGTVALSAARDCRYVPNPDAGWLSIVDNGLGSGNAMLTYLVRPNPSASARTASFTAGGATFTVTQEGATALGALRRLPYPVAAAGYSRALDRLVLVSSSPRELHLYDPVTGDDQFVPLFRSALSVALNPAGTQAVVGHDGFLSLINLNPLTVANMFNVYVPATSVELGRTGFAYFSSNNSYTTSSVNLTTRTVNQFSIFAYGRLRVTSSGDFLYTNSNFSKWDIRQGAPSAIPSNVSYNGCEAFWFLPDGSRFLNTCGQFYDASLYPAVSPEYRGAIAGVSTIQTADYSAARRSFVFSPGQYSSNPNRIGIVGDEFLGPAGTLTFPQLSIGTSSFTALPQSVSWNSAQDSVFTVLRANDSNGQVLSPFFVHVLSANPPDAGCTITPQRTLVGVSLNGGFDSVSVVAGPACAWLASSTASWVTVTSGAFGIGAANIALSIAPNTTGAPRSATLNVAGTNVTITQAAVACTYAISASAFSAGAGSTTGSVNVTAPAGCGWNATSSAAWITFSSGSSGIGNGTVNFSVAANTGSTFRTGTFTVNGLLYTVTQARQGAPDPIFNDVPPSSPFYDYIALMSQNSITAGCSTNPPLYCPDTPVTRAQMAVFIVLALNRRLGTTLTYSPTPYFNDMQPVSGYFPFVQRIKEIEITAGCSVTPPLYCSDSSITHGQMAVFIIRSWMQANNLTSFTFPATPYFTDVPATHPFFRFIQKMRELGFWNGCSANQYCDSSAVTRAHMSPMIMKGILGVP